LQRTVKSAKDINRTIIILSFTLLSCAFYSFSTHFYLTLLYAQSSNVNELHFFWPLHLDPMKISFLFHSLNALDSWTQEGFVRFITKAIIFMYALIISVSVLTTQMKNFPTVVKKSFFEYKHVSCQLCWNFLVFVLMLWC